MPTSPASLTDRLRADDALALARLVDETYGRCLAMARSLHASEAAAERAVLDAYVALWLARRALPTTAGDAGLEAWLASALVGAAGRRTDRPPRRSWARHLAGSRSALGRWWCARPWRRLHVGGARPTGAPLRGAPLSGPAGVPCP